MWRSRAHQWFEGHLLLPPTFTDANSNCYGNRYRHCYGNGYRNCYGNRDCHCYGNGYRNFYCNCYGNRYRHCYREPDHSDCQRL